MIGAKDILIKLKGDNKHFKGQVTGANTSMKGFATTTKTSTAVAATSTKAMSLSMAASLAVATAGITVVIGGVMALVGALKAGVAGAAEDAEATARTIALLEQQGVAWESVGGHILNYIEDLERLTLFGDTELQTSFNELISAGMSVEGALEGMSAAAAIANGTEMSLAGATKALGNEYATGTSRLRSLGYETETYAEMIALVNERVGDGSHVTDTASGKFELLKIEFMDQAKIVGADLLPVISDLLNALIWGAKNVLPILIHMFKMLIIPIKATITAFTILVNTANAAWEALNGNFDVARAHLETNLKLTKEFNEETYNTILNIKEEAVEVENLGKVLDENLVVQEATVLAVEEQNKKTETQLSLRERMLRLFKDEQRAKETPTTPYTKDVGIQEGQWLPSPYEPSSRPGLQLPSGSRSGI